MADTRRQDDVGPDNDQPSGLRASFAQAARGKNMPPGGDVAPDDAMCSRGRMTGIKGPHGTGVDVINRGYIPTDGGLDVPPKKIDLGMSFVFGPGKAGKADRVEVDNPARLAYDAPPNRGYEDRRDRIMDMNQKPGEVVRRDRFAGGFLRRDCNDTER